MLFTQVRPAEFTHLKDEWKKVTGPLEKAKEKPLRFLRYFLMANYAVRSDWRDGVIREDEIYDWLVDKENASLCGYRDDPFAFVRKVIRNVDLFIGFTKGLANDGQASAAMESMQKLCGAAFSLHYMLLLAAAHLPRTLFDPFVRQMESFLFFYIFTKTPTKDLERNFSLWADELRRIGEITEPAGKTKALDNFVAERFQANMDAKRPELTDALRRYSLSSMQQYRTRYLLAKLTQHVEMSFKGMRTPGPLTDFITLEIEHVLPNTPSPQLRASFAEANPGRVYDEQKARLGNLTLLEKPINIVAGNDFFALKKAEYAKSANYLTRSIVGLTEVGKNSSITRITANLSSFDSWSAAAIEKRQDMLIGLAAEIWKTNPMEQS